MRNLFKQTMTAIVLAAAIFVSCFGCTPATKVTFAFDGDFKQISPFYEGYAIVSDLTGDKLIDTQGNSVLTESYDQILGVSEGLICVEQAGKYGFLNLDGSIAIPLQYYSATIFSENFARITLRHGYGMQFNFIDKEGNQLFDFAEGSAKCQLQTRLGESVTVEISNTIDFSNGVAAIANQQQYWAMIDSESRLLTDFVFQEIQPFTNTIAKCKDMQGRLIYVNAQGNTVFSLNADDSFSCISERIRFVRDNLFGFVDDKGTTIIQAKYFAATDFGKDTPYAIVTDSENIAYVIDLNGNAVKIQANVSEFNSFSDGIAVLRLTDNSYAYVDTQGRISKQRFSYADSCAYGLCPVKQGNQFGYFEKSLLIFG